MTLCFFCLSLPPKLFSYKSNDQCTIDHHPSYLSLQESGKGGCELCNLLLHAIQKRSEDPNYEGHIPSWSTTEAITVRSTKFISQVISIGHKEVGAFRGRLVPPEWSEGYPLVFKAGNDADVRLCKQWLQICLREHKDCNGIYSGGFVPTRLVDVGSSNSPEVRLRHTVGLDLKDPRYLALSHCWGLTMPPSATTTSATLPERLRSIPLANLTRTFLDCITIARKLDIQYIWIDSLCILQDSRSDWEQEAAQMASVYSNAYCTISASGSSDGNGGCHVDENSRAYGPVTLSWDNMDQKIRTFSLFGESILNVLINDPLTQRAWTLQERELSPRVLHYSHDAVRWECRSLKASSTFPWEDSSAFNGALRAFDVGQISGVTAHELDQEQREKNETAWFDTVFKYSGRALTKHSDRLPAISGIARAVQIVTDDTYLAGLWRSNLLRCLLWTSAWYDSKGLISHTRPESFLAPSWSWASVAGQVKYETWIFDALHPAPDTRLLPTILEASTIPVGFDAFGQCKGGAIRLKGRLKPAMTLGEGFARQDREGLYNLAADVDTPVKVGDIRWDVPSEAPAGRIQGLICLCAAIRKEKLGDTVGLAIVPVAGEGSLEFRRVGLVSMLLVSWWEKSVELEVTIV